MKSWYCENNYNLQNNYCVAVNYFSKRSTADVWKDSEYASSSEYPRILEMFLLLNVPKFWIYQGSECASSFEYDRILNISEFWICQGYTGLRICLNNFWICVNMLDYLLICLNVPEYAGKCMNIPKSVWIAFVSPFPTSPFVWQSLSTSTRGYLFERLQETRSYSRKEHEAVFLKRQNLIFSIAPESISFVFYFRLNIFTSNI